MKAKHLEGKNKSEVYQYKVKLVQSSVTGISRSCYTENVEVRDEVSHCRVKQKYYKAIISVSISTERSLYSSSGRSRSYIQRTNTTQDNTLDDLQKSYQKFCFCTAQSLGTGQKPETLSPHTLCLKDKAHKSDKLFMNFFKLLNK